MANIDHDTVERLAQGIEETLAHRLGLGKDVRSTEANALRALRAALDAAEAEKRAAVAAAYEASADVLLNMWASTNLDHEHAIRALSDTDALAEYAEKVRAEEREKCASTVVTWCNRSGLEMQGNRLSDLIREDK